MSATVSLRRRQFRADEVTAAPTDEGMLIHVPGLAIGCYFSGISHAGVLDGMLPGGTK